MLIFISACSILAMIVCVFEHVQWRWALNDRLARSYGRYIERRLLLDSRAPEKGALPALFLPLPAPGKGGAATAVRSGTPGSVERMATSGARAARTVCPRAVPKSVDRSPTVDHVALGDFGEPLICAKISVTSELATSRANGISAP